MEALTSLMAVLTGAFLRLALPIAFTALLIFFLRRLDARWQAEAELQPLPANKPDCWKIKGCTPEQRRDCIAASSPLPCWQVYRLPNGYLRDECLTCRVFTNAPMPQLKIQPRRM